MNRKRITLYLLVLSALVSLYALLAFRFNLPVTAAITPGITLISLAFALLHASQREGWLKTGLLLVIVFFTGLIFESLGVATGWVYGPYHYTDQLGPKFLGLVPYLIPLAWTYMIYPSMVIAGRVVPETWTGLKRGVLVAALSGVIMTAWDVVMDPMMVFGGNWVWEVKGAYFGVPLQNFWGWWLTTFVAVGIFQLVSRRMKANVIEVPDRWAVILYGITGVTSIVTCLMIDLGGAALAGLFAMLPWFAIGWLRTQPREKD